MPGPLLTPARALLLAAAVTGCYGTPRTDWPGSAGASGGGASGSNGGVAGSVGAQSGGAGGASGSGGSLGGASGSNGGQAATGGTGTGGTGGSGMGGSSPVFVGGPCVVTPDRTAVEVFGRTSDGRILRRAFDGVNWGGWTSLIALDGKMIDARSDLDCSATITTVHIVASGLSPVGALLHAFGFGTAYNPFIRELPGLTFGPGPSVALVQDGDLFLGVSAPGLFELVDGSSPKELSPITTQTDTLRSSPDIAVQATPSSAFHYFVTLEATGALAIYYYVTSSAPGYWASPVKLQPPTGSFTFSPTVCTENGSAGVSSVNVVAVAGGRVWYARTSSISTPFSTWTMIGTDAASSPDCAVAGETDSIVHIVTLSAAGTVLDINGKDASWVVTDLGSPH